MKKIFISYSTPINKEQQIILEQIKNILLKFDCEYITVNNISDKNPFYKIQAEINKSDALVCLGFIKNTNGLFKKRYHTSSWLDVELSLAFQRGLKYYIFCDNRIEDTCILNRKFKLPQINYIHSWEEIDMNNFIQWLKTI